MRAERCAYDDYGGEALVIAHMEVHICFSEQVTDLIEQKMSG
jgi:hypothetical protein